MNNPPAIHLLVASVTFQRAACGLTLVDPEHERIVTNRARVTCKACRRAAHLDRRPRVAVWLGKE